MKKVAAAALAAALVLTTSAVFAAPVEFNGDVKAHYRWNTNSADTDLEGGKFQIRLNAKMALDENVDVYARFAAQTLTADRTGGDFASAGPKDANIARLDQYGLILKNGDWNYKVGRQGVSITPTALLYSSEGYIGEDMSLLKGVVATGKSGETSLQVVVGNNDITGNDDKNHVYAVHGSVSPAQNWTVGATVAKYQPEANADSKYWGVDASYAMGKATLLVDYLKSDADTRNSAYVAGVDYAFDEKNSVSIYAHKTNENSHIATDWDSGQKGFYYSYNYNFDKATSFNLFYKDNKDIYNGDENTSLRTTVTYKF